MGLPETDFFGLIQPEKKIGNGVHNMFVRDLFSPSCLQKICITRVCSNLARVIRKPQLTANFVAGHVFHFNQQHKIFESYRCLSVFTNGSVTKNSKSAHWSQSLRLEDRTKRVLHQSLGNAVPQHLLFLQHKQRNVPSVRCLSSFP